MPHTARPLRSLMAFTLLAGSALAACGVDDGDGGGTAGAGNQQGTSANEVRVCAPGATLEGIDVSYYQGTIDWAAVVRSGRAFAIARVSDGLHRDTQFATNWAAMRAAGIVRGAYQFFRPETSAADQADLMIAAVGTLGAGDLAPVLDVESADGVSPANIAAGVQTWVERVQAATGRTPIVYTGMYFWRDQVRATPPEGVALWIAQYGPTCPNLPPQWSTWTFFQYNDHGTVPGINDRAVDLDRFNGTMDDLLALAGGSPTTDSPSGTPDPTSDCSSVTDTSLWVCTADGTARTRCNAGQRETDACANGCAAQGAGQDDVCSDPPSTTPPTSDPCASATDCASCTAMASCGWCAGACRSGSASGPTDGACGADTWAWTAGQCGGGTTPGGTDLGPCPLPYDSQYWNCASDGNSRFLCSNGRMIASEPCPAGCEVRSAGEDDVCY